MKLVACPNCHAQYDVTQPSEESFLCHCGHSVPTRIPDAVDRAVHRCGACGALVQGDTEECTYCGAAIVRDEPQGSLLCPECYARNADSSRFCTACGIAFQPQAPPDSLCEWPCPCCGGLMPARAVGGVALNECAKCHGLWVPQGRLDALVERALEARQRRAPLGFSTKHPREIVRKAPASLLAYRRCPVCEAFMLRQNYERRSGIIVDVCSAHGTWLDADELEAIGAFILSGGLTDARAKEAEVARDEQRRRREQKVQLALLSQRASSRGPHSQEESPAHGWVLELLRQLFS